MRRYGSIFTWHQTSNVTIKQRRRYTTSVDVQNTLQSLIQSRTLPTCESPDKERQRGHPRTSNDKERQRGHPRTSNDKERQRGHPRTNNDKERQRGHPRTSNDKEDIRGPVTTKRTSEDHYQQQERHRGQPKTTNDRGGKDRPVQEIHDPQTAKESGERPKQPWTGYVDLWQQL